MPWYEVYDEDSGKTLEIWAASLEEAVAKSEHIDFFQKKEGETCKEENK